MTQTLMTYRKAGVDVEGADAWLSRMRPLIRTTRRAGVLPDPGRFAGLFGLKTLRLRDPVLVASTDGVGTKLKIAQGFGSHEGIGLDVVAMNTNDVLCLGAQPLFFLDYLAVGSLQPSLMSALLRGIVEGCRQSGCALIGGETAEMPGVYQKGEYDLAGFCVAVVERSRIIDGSKVRSGDGVVGVASSGLHANGFSLVRQIFDEKRLLPLKLRRQLLIPTRIYVKPVLQALARMPVAALAHITGGGLSRRLPMLVAKRSGLRVRLFPGSWPVPRIFQTIQQAGGIMMDEMMRTFNMGIGMALVCRASDSNRLIQLMNRSGLDAWSIGVVESRQSSVSGQ